MNRCLSYSFGEPNGLRYSTETLSDLINNAARVSGDKLAVVSFSEGIRKTYKELLIDVNAFAKGLSFLGLKRGDLVGIWSPSCYEWVVTYLAVGKSGMISVCINSYLREKEMCDILKMMNFSAIAISATFKSQDYYDILCRLLPNVKKSCSASLLITAHPTLKVIIQFGNYKNDGTLLFREVLELHSNEDLGEGEKLVQFDDPIHLQFTSGTTGKPKAAVVTHFTVINSSRAIGSSMGAKKDDVICNPMPLFHAFGCINGLVLPIYFHSTIVLPSPSYSTEVLVKAIQETRCNKLLAVPTMLHDILNLKNLKWFDISSLKIVKTGGASGQIELFKKCESQLGVKILNGYGMTELYGPCFRHPSDPEISLGSVGKVLPNVEVKIVDTNGDIVELEATGEILVRGPSVFEGYWDDDEKTKEATAPGKWFRTGDLGRFDKSYFLFIEGRLKELIIRGGENINPKEIEKLLDSHPGIAEASVVGVPDNRLGEEICACVCVKDGVVLTENQIRYFLKGKISNFKIPKFIVFRKNFPKTTTNRKVQKVKLLEEVQKILSKM